MREREEKKKKTHNTTLIKEDGDHARGELFLFLFIIIIIIEVFFDEKVFFDFDDVFGGARSSSSSVSGSSFSSSSSIRSRDARNDVLDEWCRDEEGKERERRRFGFQNATSSEYSKGWCFCVDDGCLDAGTEHIRSSDGFGECDGARRHRSFRGGDVELATAATTTNPITSSCDDDGRQTGGDEARTRPGVL